MKLRVELDTSGAQQAVDELDDKIRNSDAFKVLKDGWTFEKNGVLIIKNGLDTHGVPLSIIHGFSIEAVKAE
ncbi:hypothetical protein AAEQ23_002593 [Enterobacter hormaechei]